MKLFESAALKMTGWYLMVIMFVCVSFSAIVYDQAAGELERSSTRQTTLFDRFGLRPTGVFESERMQLVADAKKRIITRLILLNFLVLAVGGYASWLWAKRTLQPIEEAIELQDRFISDASHELRTPLAAMRAEIDVALRKKLSSKSQFAEVLVSNREEVIHLQKLTDSLLLLSTQPNQLISKQNLDAYDLAQKAISQVSHRAVAKDQILTNSIAKDSLYIFGDEAMLVEVIVIFLDNAVKYSSEKSQIIINATKDASSVKISVSDKGQGIKKSDLPHVFDRFYKADPSRSQLNEYSYGLGLSIAKHIVELHGGVIGVNSVAGKGSTFNFAIKQQPK